MWYNIFFIISNWRSFVNENSYSLKFTCWILYNKFRNFLFKKKLLLKMSNCN